MLWTWPSQIGCLIYKNIILFKEISLRIFIRLGLGHTHGSPTLFSWWARRRGPRCDLWPERPASGQRERRWQCHSLGRHDDNSQPVWWLESQAIGKVNWTRGWNKQGELLRLKLIHLFSISDEWGLYQQPRQYTLLVFDEREILTAESDLYNQSFMAIRFRTVQVKAVLVDNKRFKLVLCLCISSSIFDCRLKRTSSY